MSIGSVIVMPTPTAGPLIAAITGFSESKMRSVNLPAGVARHPPSCLPVAPVERVAAAAQVRSGAEAAALAGDDDRAHVVVGIGAVERLDQLASHGRRKRVQPVGPVERNGQNVVRDLVADLLELHVGPPVERGSVRQKLPS